MRDKLHEVGVAEAKKLLKAHDVKVTCLCVGGTVGLTRILNCFGPTWIRRGETIDEAAELEAECVVFVCRRGFA